MKEAGLRRVAYRRGLAAILVVAGLVACRTPADAPDQPSTVAQSAPYAASGDAPVVAPTDLLKRTGERYHAIFAAVDVPDEARERLRAANDQAVFEYFARGAIRANAANAARLLDLRESEPDPALRRALLEAQPLSGANASVRARALVRTSVESDPDVSQAIRSAERLASASRLDVVFLLKARLRRAQEAGDQDGAARLREQIDRIAFGEVTLPAYRYRAPARFTVAAAATSRVRALVFGDFGTGAPSQAETARAMAKVDATQPFTFGLTTGDNFYPSGLDDPTHERWRTEWEALYAPLQIKFYPTFGNHDVHRDSAAAELDYTSRSRTWVFPAPYYTFTAGAAQFFALDTTRLTDAQLAWLDRELKASTARWKIVYGHHQIFSATRGDNDARQEDLVGRLLPLLTANEVDLYLCGHDHNLQELQPVEGVHFFVMGAGGAPLYDATNDYPRSVFRAKEHGFGVVEASADALVISLIALDGRTLHARTLRR